MEETNTINYWLFQAKPNSFDLPAALRGEALTYFPVKAHRQRIQIGDRVILWATAPEFACFALATVTSEVGAWEWPAKDKAFWQELPQVDTPSVQLRIDYNLWDRPISAEQLGTNPAFENFNAGLPGTNYRATVAQFHQLVALIEAHDSLHEPAAMYLPRKARRHPLNTILYGPPGTGKTFTAVSFALSVIENRSLEELALEERAALRQRFNDYLEAGQIGFVTFHQAFAYEDFVEGIKPRTLNEQVVYEIEDGIFKQLNQRAIDDPNQAYVLVIDEINRGNIAAIFGELITLLEPDKRIGAAEALQLRLPYSKTEFSVPANLYLVATMNTADRSVESLDLALRRRFHFVEMLPDPAVIEQLAERPFAAGIDLAQLLRTINQRIELLLSRDYCIGHTYFLEVETLADLQTIFASRIIPLLQEYFMGDYSKIGLVLGKSFVQPVPPADATTFADFSHDYAGELADRPLYELRPVEELTERDFIKIYNSKFN